MNYLSPRIIPRSSKQKQPWAAVAIALLLLVTLLILVRERPASAQSFVQTQDGPMASPLQDAWIVQIPFTQQETVDRLAAEFDVWSVNHQGGFAVALVDATDRAMLQAQGIDFTVDQSQMKMLNSLRQLQHGVAAASPFQPLDGIPGYACYRTVEETYTTMDSLAADYPDLAQVMDIGDSWDKAVAENAAGYDIKALVLTNRNNTISKPKFLLIGAVHAREYTTSELATRFGERLIEQYETDPDIRWLLDYAEVHIIPIANPDGRKEAEKLIYWRKNHNLIDGACSGTATVTRHGGVDLNRNSSFQWNGCGPGQSCSSSNPCAQTYRGTSAASEPETQALEAYMSGIFSDTRPITHTAPASLDTEGIMITLHSYSEQVLFPWGWSNEPSPNDAELATLGRKFGYYTGYEVCQSGSPSCIYRTDGTTDDWAYGELGIAAYTFELGTEFFQQCSFFEENILEPNMDALLYATKAARLPYQLPSGPEITEVTLSAQTIMTSANLTLTVTADDSRFNANGPWGIEPTQVISAARYSINQPSWISGTQLYSMTVQNGALDGALDDEIEDFVALVDAAAWEAGQHTIFVEAQDAEGNWGVPTATELTVALNEFEVAVQDEPEVQPITLGGSASYTFTLENIGWSADLYTLTVTSTWPIELMQTTVKLDPGEQRTLTFTVRPSSSITTSLSSITEIQESVTVSVESQGAGQAINQIEMQAVAIPERFYFPFVELELP